ncbi:unnamed protein product [Calypogeia fissa]
MKAFGPGPAVETPSTPQSFAVSSFNSDLNASVPTSTQSILPQTWQIAPPGLHSSITHPLWSRSAVGLQSLILPPIGPGWVHSPQGTVRPTTLALSRNTVRVPWPPPPSHPYALSRLGTASVRR